MEPACLDDKINEICLSLQQERNFLTSITNHQSEEFLQTSSKINELLNRLDKLGISISNLEEINSKVHEMRQVHSVCQVLAKLHSELERFNSVLNYSLEEAVSLYVANKEKVESLGNEDSPLMKTILEKLSEQGGTLRAQLESAWSEAVYVDTDVVRVQKCIKKGSVFLSLTELLELLEKLDLKQNKKTQLLEKLTQNVLALGSCRVKLVEQKNESRLDFFKENETSEISEVLNRLEIFIDFVVSEFNVLSLGKTILEDIAVPHLLSALFLSISEKAVSSEEYQTYVCSVIKEFENHLAETKVVEKNYQELSNQIKNSHENLLKNRETSVLNYVRELVLSEDVKTVEVSDFTERNSVSSLLVENNKKKASNSGNFKLPLMSISENTHKLVEKFYEVLEEALSQSKESSLLKLLKLSRSIITLFKALKAHSLGHKKSQPLAAALFYNNCVYVTHHLVLMPASYMPRVPPHLKYSVYMADLIPLIKTEADSIFSEMFNGQKDNILNCLKGIKLQDIELRYSEMEKMLDRALGVLSGTARTWKEVLSAQDYCKAVGKLGDSLIAHMISLVLKLNFISTDDTPPLTQLISKLFGIGQMLDSPSQYFEHWERLNLLVKILDSDLMGIVEMHNQGLYKGKFTLYEIRQLVKAIFEDNQNRTDALKQLVN